MTAAATMLTATLSTRRRAVAAVLWLVTIAMLVGAVRPTAADAASPESADFVGRINAERSSAGLSTLTRVAELDAVAARHAQRMAESGDLHHNPSLGTDVGSWQRLTENVGRGGDVDDLHDAFMDSPSHRGHILDTGVTEVGVGTAWADGILWVTQVFRLPETSAGPPPPAPAPPPATSATAPPSAPSEPTPPPVVVSALVVRAMPVGAEIVPAPVPFSGGLVRAAPSPAVYRLGRIARLAATVLILAGR